MTTIVIENAILVRLARRAIITSEFPFIAPAAQARSCHCSGNNDVDFDAIKAAIGSLSPEGRARFKALVQAEKVRVIWNEGGTKFSEEF